MADTEREAFEKAINAQRFFPRELDFSRGTSPGGRDEYVNSHIESNWNGWKLRAALASRPAEVDDEGLPPLPQPMRKVYERPHGIQELLYYTAEQFRQGQRDAVAADRASRESIDGQLHGEPAQSNDLPCLLCKLNHGRVCWAHKRPSHTTNKEK